MFYCLFFSNGVLPIPCIHLSLLHSGPLLPDTLGICQLSPVHFGILDTCLILIPFSAINKYLLNHLQPREMIHTWGPCPHLAHSLKGDKCVNLTQNLLPL